MHGHDEDKGKDLTDYVKLSVDELTTLLKSYDDKIKDKEESHWINTVQKKVSFNIRKLLKRVLLGFLGVFIIFIIVFMIFSWGNQKEFAEKALTWFMPMMFFIIPVAFIVQLLDDGTTELYKERNKIALILKNKHKPKKEDMPNPRAVSILKLLAKHPDGLNRADIIKLLQKEFGKSLDPKTIDEYLRQLGDSIKIDERFYKSPTGGHDMDKTKVYVLK